MFHDDEITELRRELYSAEKRIEKLETAIKSWIKKYKAHGPFNGEWADIHWPIYEADYNMFITALAEDSND